MYLKQISLFVENKSGRFAEITELLQAADVDIRAFSVADTSDYGILRLIVSDPDAAVRVLKEANLSVRLTDVLAIALEDRPGGLAGALRVLCDGGIAVEYMYAFVSREENRAFVILRVEDNARAQQVLSANGIPLLDSKDLYKM